VKDTVTEEEKELATNGVFVAIGHIPNSKVFPGIDVDEKGFIKVQDHFKTNIEGVFVAGDVHDKAYMQAITAAGFGCAAALEAERWLEAQK
jgi:thioredoxin reductase (NADPH)